MDILFQIDWQSVFVPSVGILEIIIRGTIIYLSLFVLLRVLRREAGSLGITDILVIVLIADAAQNGMAGEYKSVTEGLILVMTICFWDYFLDWLGHRIPAIQRLIHPAPLLLIKDGQMLRKNMRQEMITQDELVSLIRQQGVESASEVKACYLESDGGISVVKKQPDDSSQGPKKKERPFS
ncbi:DUF421 domain-containing protein [Methylobacter sp. YRD-M1]|uniref:DUF421 domain-containing protein n=1 Tax=Methylobacter sp. YRD-M1 TaxID=2911520 RepID=UPI00227BE61C|nr:YetF domain-containing protein [Methylobacter sp. YRD-M1]WAK00922.1 DUF421 domain-containing protein [Methylobacter sp. YRD-M1]